MNPLTHFNLQGDAHMVDVGQKTESARKAVACGTIRMLPETFQQILSGTAKKGDVLGIARLAAIQGTKHTALLIPLCHPLSLTHVDVAWFPQEETATLKIEVTTQTIGRTGVEMEALSGVMAGLLTVYDMLKAVDRGMCIEAVHLVSKEGGKSGVYSV